MVYPASRYLRNRFVEGKILVGRCYQVVNFVKLIVRISQAQASRFGHSADVIGDHLYLFGGRSELKEVLYGFVRLHIPTNTWTHVMEKCSGNGPSGIRPLTIRRRIYVK